MLSADALKRRQDAHERAKAHDFILRELELGWRAAVLFGNEAEGWGPWVDTSGMFGIDYAAVDRHSEWIPNPHTQAKPFVPRQREPVD